jgi:hypothetical protein
MITRCTVKGGWCFCHGEWVNCSHQTGARPAFLRTEFGPSVALDTLTYRSSDKEVNNHTGSDSYLQACLPGIGPSDASLPQPHHRPK